MEEQEIPARMGQRMGRRDAADAYAERDEARPVIDGLRRDLASVPGGHCRRREAA